MAASRDVVSLLDASLTLPAGTLAARVLRCRGLAQSAPMLEPTDPGAYIRADWIGASRVKSALASVEVTGNSDGAIQRDFLGQAQLLTVVGRLPGIRMRPMLSRPLVRTGGTSGGFVAEGAAAPLAGLRFTRGSRLEGRRVAVHDVVAREELMREPGLDAALTSELSASFAGAVDAGLLSATEDGTGAAPAGILHGAASTAATGDAEQDVRLLFGGYVGDWRRAAILLHPMTAVELGLALTGTVSDTRLGVNGGVIAGVPAVTSDAVPFDSTGATIAIVDQGALAFAMEVTEVAASTHATMEMDDAPSMNSITPAAANLVSMFQTNSVALRAEGSAAWQLLRADAIFCLEGASYAIGS